MSDPRTLTCRLHRRGKSILRARPVIIMTDKSIISHFTQGSKRTTCNSLSTCPKLLYTEIPCTLDG